MIETNFNGKTPDIAEENVAKLKTIFPDVFTEGKIDFDKLQQVLGNYIETSNERYNFSWNGKAKALSIAQTRSTGTLRPLKSESKDWDTTQNLYIEGDNLEVLKLLQKSYHSKVKMIYIDPPYNTGNDFVYPDNFTDNIENYKFITGQVDADGKNISSNSETSGRYHTNWLNMMYPRLRLARNVLTDDGVIFISIDDNEVDNLKKICNEVFGESNFVGLFTIQSNPRGSQASKYLANVHEYICMFAKNISELALQGFEKSQENLSEYSLTDKDGKKYRLLGLRQRGGAWKREDRPNMYYPIYVNPLNGEVSLEKDESFSIEVLPKRPTGEESRWTWGKGKFLTDINLIRGKAINRNGDDNAWDIFRIDYLETEDGKIKTTKVKTMWIEKEINYQNGRSDIKELFANSEIFDFPKPTYLIKQLIRMIDFGTNDIILDFFSGSATTAHATMQLNAEDDGNRKFIMVQLPEPTDEKDEAYKAGYKNICEIGKERIRRAGDKIKEEKGLEAQNLDIGFKVLKLDSSNIRKWQPDYENLELSLEDFVDNYVEGRTEFDVLYEIMLKYGLDLTYPVEEYTIDDKKVYSIGFGMLIICLDDELTTEIANGILDIVKELAPESTRVVFKDNGFETDSNKTNIKEILKCGGIEEFITL